MKQDIRTDTQYSTAPSATAPSPTAPLEGDLYSVEPVAAPYVFGGSNVDIPYAHATAVEVVHECDHKREREREREREHKAITPTDPEERVPVAWPTGAPPTQPPQTPGSVATQQATAHQNNNNNSSGSSSSSSNNKRRKTPPCCCICIGATCSLVIIVICAIVGIDWSDWY